MRADRPLVAVFRLRTPSFVLWLVFSFLVRPTPSPDGSVLLFHAMIQSGLRTRQTLLRASVFTHLGKE